MKKRSSTYVEVFQLLNSVGSGINNGNGQDAILTKRKHESEPFSKRVRSQKDPWPNQKSRPALISCTKNVTSLPNRPSFHFPSHCPPVWLIWEFICPKANSGIILSLVQPMSYINSHQIVLPKLFLNNYRV